MGNELVSIIIPVYNVEPYIDECVKSVINQDYENIEIILVDDGSTDNSGILCDELAKTDERIVVIHQLNCGVVTARNKGVIQAKGKYICFVDADDTIANNMISIMTAMMKDVDVVDCGVMQETKNGSVQKLRDGLEEGLYQKKYMEYLWKNMIRYREDDVEGILQYCFGKLYRKSILKRIFDKLDSSIKYCEDRELVYRYFLECKSAYIMHNYLYFYRYRKDSCVRKSNETVMHDLNKLYTSLSGTFREHYLEDSLMKQLQMVIASRCYMITSLMGFAPFCQNVRYIFPFYNMLNGKRIVLYGAGVVGCNYYWQIRKSNEIDLVLWVDKSEHSDKVTEPEQLHNVEYDYIIISVKDKYLADKIIDELIAKGIDEKKLLWREPLALAE